MPTLGAMATIFNPIFWIYCRDCFLYQIFFNWFPVVADLRFPWFSMARFFASKSPSLSPNGKSRWRLLGYLHAKRLSKGAILTQYRREEKEFKRNNIQLTPFFADNTSHVAEAISLFSSFSPAFHSKSIYFSSIYPRNKWRYVAKYNKFVANASNVHRKAPKLFVKSQKSLYLCTSD